MAGGTNSEQYNMLINCFYSSQFLYLLQLMEKAFFQNNISCLLFL
jgi:hypothetical protein